MPLRVRRYNEDRRLCMMRAEDYIRQAMLFRSSLTGGG
jgi:hypothetical protein